MDSTGFGAFAPVRVGFLRVAFFLATFFLAALFGAAFLAFFFFTAFRVEGRLRALFFRAPVFFLRAALRVFFLAAISGSSHVRQLARCATGLLSDRVIRICTGVQRPENRPSGADAELPGRIFSTACVRRPIFLRATLLGNGGRTGVVSEQTSETERVALAALGYSEAWLQAGILDRQLLADQYARFQTGGTKKTVGYRTQALAAWRAGGGPIPDAELDAFLSLMGAEADPKLADAAIAALIQSPRLHLDQLQRIAGSDPKLMRRHESLIRRIWFKRRMDQGVTDELLERVIESRDAAIQTGLIRDSRLSRKHAELLAKQGANPTIRAKAQAWFQDKKSWKSK